MGHRQGRGRGARSSPPHLIPSDSGAGEAQAPVPPAPPSPPPPSSGPWWLRDPDGTLRTPWRIIGFFGVALAGYVAVALLLSALGFAGIIGQASIPMAGAMLSVIPAAAATWFMMRRVEWFPWSWAALDREGARRRPLAIGAAWGAAAIVVPILVLLAIGWARFESAGPGSAVLSALLLALFLAPAALAEELLLRGYPFAVIRDRWGAAAAIIATSVTFGLLHSGNPGAGAQSIALVTLAGIFLGTVLVATGSLYAAWAAHFAWNWVMAAIFHAPVSGWPFPTPVYKLVETGPDWATGGRWGPEGGLLAGIALVGATIWLARKSNA